MNNFIAALKEKWNNVLRPKKLSEVTPKGLALTSYINNKYFTKEKSDDYIEAYHQTIMNTKKTLEKTSFFSSFNTKNNQEITEEDKEGLSAFITIVFLIMGSDSASKQKIYEYITDPAALEAVKFFIAQNIIKIV